ncbi:hypothetical protein ACFGVR_04060 [Mucilaginibacter sp. AW1-3]
MATDNNIDIILNDKTIKAKGKVAAISQLLMDGGVAIQQLIAQAQNANDINKATLMESMEYVSRLQADIIDAQGFEFAVESLRSTAPRLKWESAKVIANTAQLFPGLLKGATVNLLDNTEHSGTIVRWSAAGALSKIMLCKTDLNQELISAIKAIEKREEDNAIKKIYQHALKKVSE